MAKFNFNETPELYQSSFYRAWSNMKTRCSNKNIKEYVDYGGRGIKICDKWETFFGFYEDMYNIYVASNAKCLKLSLDRIDNSKGYSFENCRWATKKEQANNTRNIDSSKKYDYLGEKYRVSELAKKFNIKRTTLDQRLRVYGWGIEKSLLTNI